MFDLRSSRRWSAGHSARLTGFLLILAAVGALSVARGGNAKADEPISITVSAATDTRTYDGTTSSSGIPSITLGTLATDHVLDGCTQTFNTATASSTPGNKTLTASGCVVLDSANGYADVTDGYIISYVTATGTINKRAITVTAATATKTYDGTTTSSGSPTRTSGTLVSGHSLSGCSQTFNSASASASANDKTLTASGCSVLDALLVNRTANYTITYDTAAGTINKRAITVAAATDTKTYDGTTTSSGVPTLSSGTLVTNHNLSGCTQTFDSPAASASAGDKTLTASGCSVLDSGNSNADVSLNYTITYPDTAEGTIDQATLTVTADDDTITYGDAEPTDFTFTDDLYGSDTWGTEPTC
ncbi:MAG: hypothetical protein ACKOA9_11920, partial [Actinomycetota bacterium]